MGLIFSYPLYIDVNDRVIAEMKILKRNLLFTPPAFFYLLICANPVAAPGVIVKKECYEKLGKFQALDLAADYDMWLRIALNYPVIYIDKPLFSYRTHSENLSKTIPEKEKLREKLLSYKKIMAEFAQHSEVICHIKNLTEMRYRYAMYKYLSKLTSQKNFELLKRRIIKFNMKFTLRTVLDFLKSIVQKPNFFEVKPLFRNAYYYPRYGFFLNIASLKIYLRSMVNNIKFFKFLNSYIKKYVKIGLT